MSTVTQPARFAKIGVGAITLALALSACGSDGTSSTNTTTKSNGSGSNGPLSGTLNASGSSFQRTLEENAIKAFTATNPNVTINYAGGGSAKGKTDLASHLVDFAGTYSAVKPADLSKLP